MENYSSILKCRVNVQSNSLSNANTFHSSKDLLCASLRYGRDEVAAKLKIIEVDLVKALEQVSTNTFESALSIINDCESQATEGLKRVITDLHCAPKKISGELKTALDKFITGAQREVASCVTIFRDRVPAVCSWSSSEPSTTNSVQPAPTAGNNIFDELTVDQGNSSKELSKTHFCCTLFVLFVLSFYRLWYEYSLINCSWLCAFYFQYRSMKSYEMCSDSRL